MITDPFEQLAAAWDEFKKALWIEFESSKLGKFMIRLADNLAARLEGSENKEKGERL